jgi:hypothetical protein
MILKKLYPVKFQLVFSDSVRNCGMYLYIILYIFVKVDVYLSRMLFPFKVTVRFL